MTSSMARLKTSSLWLSHPHLNSSSVLAPCLVSLIGRQGVSSLSSLTVLAAVSPLVREVMSSSCCHHPPTTHILLPQFEEAVVALLVQLVTDGKVIARLRECSQVLEMMQVLGMDTKHFTMDNNEARELMKVEIECDTPDSKHEEEEKMQEVEVNIVNDSINSMVCRAKQSSFVKVKAKINKTEEDPVLSDICGARRTPLVSTTPAASSSSFVFSSEHDLVSVRPVLARKKDKKLLMLKKETGGPSKKMRISSGISFPNFENTPIYVTADKNALPFNCEEISVCATGDSKPTPHISILENTPVCVTVDNKPQLSCHENTPDCVTGDNTYQTSSYNNTPVRVTRDIKPQISSHKIPICVTGDNKSHPSSYETTIIFVTQYPQPFICKNTPVTRDNEPKSSSCENTPVNGDHKLQSSSNCVTGPYDHINSQLLSDSSNSERIFFSLTGPNTPKSQPLTNFSAAGLNPLLFKNMTKSGYMVPTSVQKIAIPLILSGRDLMCTTHSGSGKTLAFLLPIIHKLIPSQADSGIGSTTACPQALIITPTRDLALQIFNEARRLTQGSMVKPAVAFGGIDTVSQERMFWNEGCNILVATLGRLLDYVGKGKITFSNIQFLVLDEADQLLDIGFLPEVYSCVQNPSMPNKEKRQTLMFSNFFPDDIQMSAAELLNDHLFLCVSRQGSNCSDMKQNFHKVTYYEKWEKLMDLMQEFDRDPREKTMIFVQTKKRANYIQSKLSEEGLPTQCIHSDRLQREREEALYNFRVGSHPILVATAGVTRGLNLPGVAHVINYDMPDDFEQYERSIGHVSRDGIVGRATTFFDIETDCDVASESEHLVKLLSGAGIIIPERRGGGRNT